MNSSELKGFLTGLIIGDGFIDSGITKRAFHIKSINFDFIKMIYDELSKTTQFKMRIKYHEQEIRNNVFHKQYWELTILSHPYFAKKYHHFYDDNKHRIVSSIAMKWLTPRGLANWYMSDGYVCLVGKEKNDIYGRRVEIATDRYSYDTVKKLTEMIFKRYNIVSSVIKRGTHYRIRICVESYYTFFSIIGPYIVDSMKYKMYLGYKRQPKWMPDEMWNYQLYLQSAITLTDNAEGYDIV